MCEVWSFLGVDVTQPDLKDGLTAELNKNPDRDWQREKAGDLIGSLEKGKAGSWRDLFTERDRVKFQDIAGDVLEAWGYSR